MITSLESARTGLQGFERSITVAAHNLANIRTDGFRPSRINFSEASTGGVATRVVPDRSYSSTLAQDTLHDHSWIEQSGTESGENILDLLLGMRGFEVNLKSIQTADSILGTVVNLKR